MKTETRTITMGQFCDMVFDGKKHSPHDAGATQPCLEVRGFVKIFDRFNADGKRVQMWERKPR